MYRFKSYRFDPTGGRLFCRARPVALRPKAALLLEFLLAHPTEVHSKERLVRAVWGHEHVEDQALFQLVSEIRARLGERDCIATYPNRGYRWGWPVARVERARRRAWLIPAATAAVLTLGLTLRPGPPDRSDPAAGMSPAMSAVSRAFQARHAGDLDGTIHWLTVAVEANPRFAAAKVELADALRARGDLERAQSYAHDALSDARIVGDHYLEATAHVLLSKLRASQGDLAGALELNAEAARIANDHGHVCAAQVSAAWQQRLALALARPGARPAAARESSILAACEAALESPQSQWLEPPAEDPTQTG